MIQGVSTAVASGLDTASAAWAEIVAACGLDPSLPAEALLRAVDNRVLCTVMCCCSANPATGAAGQAQRQQCVHETFAAADRQLGYRSRYKSEISYNMDVEPPAPFMHREGGRDTTQPSTYWQGRARSEIEDYRGGQGLVRRPDIVIVDDVNVPPYQSNIGRVVEMKFRGDAPDLEQDAAYRDIAGGALRYSRMMEGEPGPDNCRCGEQQRVDVPQTVPVPSPAPGVNWRKVAETAGFGVATAALALGTAALLLSPFEGPAGEIAAGTATAATAARTAAAFRAIFATAP